MEEIPTEVPMSVVVITNVNTVAQILKLAIRDLPDSLIPEDVYRDLVHITRAHDMNNISHEWDYAVSKRLSMMPMENMSTFAHIIGFIREVAAESGTNHMDASNLATVFAPTLFKSGMDDPIKAVMELKVSHTLLLQIILRPQILRNAVRQFKDTYRAKHGSRGDRSMTENPVLASVNMSTVVELSGMKDLNETEKTELADITSGFSPAMLQRMTRGGGGGGRMDSVAGRRLMVEDDQPDPRISEEEVSPAVTKGGNFSPINQDSKEQIKVASIASVSSDASIALLPESDEIFVLDKFEIMRRAELEADLQRAESLGATGDQPTNGQHHSHGHQHPLHQHRSGHHSHHQRQPPPPPPQASTSSTSTSNSSHFGVQKASKELHCDDEI